MGTRTDAAPETIATAEIETPIGTLRLASTDAGLAYLGLPNASGTGFAGFLRRLGPQTRARDAFAPNRSAAQQIAEYLAGKRRDFDLPLDLRGTPFQQRVWRELLRIPYGETRTYAEVARAIGRPAATRAVGLANGANPVAVVVPCHRVVAAGGKLGGYGGGLPLKRRLLAMEGSAAGDGRLL
jgi:methylated-DNA-[protein]-cysteine S-methyltransferase